MVLVDRHWETDRAVLERTFAVMKQRQWPICIQLISSTLMEGLTMFPEGTRLQPGTLEKVFAECYASDLAESRTCQEEQSTSL